MTVVESTRNYTIYLSVEEFDLFKELVTSVNYGYLFDTEENEYGVKVDEDMLYEIQDILENEKYVQEYEEYNSSAASDIGCLLCELQRAVEDDSNYIMYLSEKEFELLSSITPSIKYDYTIEDEEIKIKITEDKIYEVKELLEYEAYVQEYEEYNSSAADEIKYLLCDIVDELR